MGWIKNFEMGVDDESLVDPERKQDYLDRCAELRRRLDRLRGEAFPESGSYALHPARGRGWPQVEATEASDADVRARAGAIAWTSVAAAMRTDRPWARFYKELWDALAVYRPEALDIEYIDQADDTLWLDDLIDGAEAWEPPADTIHFDDATRETVAAALLAGQLDQGVVPSPFDRKWFPLYDALLITSHRSYLLLATFAFLDPEQLAETFAQPWDYVQDQALEQLRVYGDDIAVAVGEELSA